MHTVGFVVSAECLDLVVHFDVGSLEPPSAVVAFVPGVGGEQSAFRLGVQVVAFPFPLTVAGTPSFLFAREGGGAPVAN